MKLTYLPAAIESSHEPPGSRDRDQEISGECVIGSHPDDTFHCLQSEEIPQVALASLSSQLGGVLVVLRAGRGRDARRLRRRDIKG